MRSDMARSLNTSSPKLSVRLSIIIPRYIIKIYCKNSKAIMI